MENCKCFVDKDKLKERKQVTLGFVQYLIISPTQFASTIKNRTSQHTTKVFNRTCKAVLPLK